MKLIRNDWRYYSTKFAVLTFIFFTCLSQNTLWAMSKSPTAPLNYIATDAEFSEAYIDVDEWRDTPVKHRYVHGGFKNTDTRFSFYMSPKKQYDGRFFQYITPVPDNENLSQGATGEEDKIGFSISSGAYFVESNGGGVGATATPGAGIDPTIGAYRANAAVAQFSRAVAMQMYGSKRPYGYAFGGSGGGFRTIGGIENTEGVWDGVVPYVIGTPMTIPNVFTVRMYALRVLQDKLPMIADAVDVGSNKSPYDGLNAEEQAALAEVTKMGFPLRGWHAYPHLGMHGFAVLFPGVVMADRQYFSDFWTKPGYEGFKPPASLLAAKISHVTSIKKLIMADQASAMGVDMTPLAGQGRGTADAAWKALQQQPAAAQIPVAVQLASVPAKNTVGADLILESGANAGKALPKTRLENDILVLGRDHSGVLNGLKVGDQIRIDNANFLAAQTYHRHQVPGPEYSVWDQFRDPAGEPIYPQRPMLLGPLFAQAASGTVQTGKFKGKMILLENLYDTEAYPWSADWYRSQVKAHLGDDADKHFRLWYTDHANHGDSAKQTSATHTVSYLGVLQQALRDLSLWVEKDIAPPANTQYQLVDGQVIVPSTAAERKGIQAVVHLLANGKERAEVALGEAVNLKATVDVPADTGSVVSAYWDFDGKGEFVIAADLSEAERRGNSVIVSTTHQFDKPGTYFAVLRVATQREGDRKTPFTKIQNLGRARVVVK